MNDELKKFELLEEAVNEGNLYEVKRIVKTFPCEWLGTWNSEGDKYLLRVLNILCRRSCGPEPLLVELEIIRIINNKRLCSNQYSCDFTRRLEGDAIDNHDWKRLESLLDDAPLYHFAFEKLVKIAEKDLDKYSIKIIDKHLKLYGITYGVKYSRRKIMIRRILKTLHIPAFV